jgi:signal transduction histidine kinase
MVVDETLRREVPNDFGKPVAVYSEYLDADQPTAHRYDQVNAEFLQRKYFDRNVKVVVVVSPRTLQFILRYRDQIFPNVPVVHALISQDAIREFDLPPDVIGAASNIDDDATLALALRLHPTAKSIYVVTGTATQDRRWERQARAAAERISQPVAVQFLAGLPTTEVLRRLGALRGASIVYSNGYFLDGAGAITTPPEVAANVASVSSAPLYSRNAETLGSGAVGGYMMSRENQALQTAGIVVRLLQGTAPTEIAASPLEQVPMFDWRQLQRWGISETRLPPDSIVLYRLPSIWEQHRNLILAVLAVFALLIVLIGALVNQNRRRRRAEQDAWAMGGRLLTAHEDERKRLARELHDDVTQRLARLAIDAAQVEQRPRVGGEARKLSVHGELVRLGEDVHALSYRLHPSILDDLGLIEALKAECEQAGRDSFDVQFKSADIPDDVSKESALCIFRIGQEALRNVARHAQAGCARVELTAVNGRLVLSVNDDGVGFDPTSQQLQHSLGLAGMRERVRLVGGQLTISTARGGGTTVHASVPVCARLK